MTIKKLAQKGHLFLTIGLLLTIVFWIGSFLAEWRLIIGIIIVIGSIMSLLMLVVEWIYDRGEKAGRETLED